MRTPRDANSVPEVRPTGGFRLVITLISSEGQRAQSNSDSNHRPEDHASCPVDQAKPKEGGNHANNKTARRSEDAKRVFQRIGHSKYHIALFLRKQSLVSEPVDARLKLILSTPRVDARRVQ